MKILFLGDVVGRIAREALAKALPEMKAELEPDLVIANIENAAHGVGITQRTLQELFDAGIDYATSGDHIFDKPDADALVSAEGAKVIRPYNFVGQHPGVGFIIIEIKGEKILLANIIGQVFIKAEASSPFAAIDQILKENPINISIVDFHAEATSEKVAFGNHVDGRVTAVIGTHTHVPTADQRILPGGTAYVSDAGMVGALDSVLGMSKEMSLARFLDHETAVERIPEAGIVTIGSILLDIDESTGKARTIQRVDRNVTV